MKGTSPSRAMREAQTGNKVPRWEVRTFINSLRRGSHVHCLRWNRSRQERVCPARPHRQADGSQAGGTVPQSLGVRSCTLPVRTEPSGTNPGSTRLARTGHPWRGFGSIQRAEAPSRKLKTVPAVEVTPRAAGSEAESFSERRHLLPRPFGERAGVRGCVPALMPFDGPHPTLSQRAREKHKKLSPSQLTRPPPAAQASPCNSL